MVLMRAANKDTGVKIAEKAAYYYQRRMKLAKRNQDHRLS
jgi:hypothetical protein